METKDRLCPDCGTMLEPRVFSIASLPVEENNPDYESAFLAQAFLHCCQCGYAEPMTKDTIKS